MTINEKIKHIRLWALLCLALLFYPCALHAQTVSDIRFLTEQLPPYNYQEEGKVKGIYIDLLKEIFNQQNARFDDKTVELLPWVRGYCLVQNMPNTCLFAMARTPVRENLFKWAGPLSPVRIVLISKKNTNITVQSLDDLDTYRIGVVREDIGERLLIEGGVSKERLTYSFGQDAGRDLILELDNNIIDLFALGDIPTRWLMKKHKFHTDTYKIAYVLKTTPGYFAFSKDVPDSFILKFQQTLDQIKQDGVYDDIVRQHISDEL